MIRSFRDSNTRPVNWEAEIRSYQEELQVHGHEMSPYERNVISREIKKRQDELIPVVGAKVIGEFKGAISQYKNALFAIATERTKEINRFDSAKLNQEMQLLQTRVDLALKGDVNELHGDAPISARLQQVYAEAVQSGDLHKQRAAVEVIKALPLPGSGENRIVVNQLARDAAKAEQALRQTDGTIKAAQDLQAAEAMLQEKIATLDKTSQILGMGSIDDIFNPGPFAKAARMVEYDRNHADDDGGPTGAFVIHEENDPAVTGVYWKGT